MYLLPIPRCPCGRLIAAFPFAQENPKRFLQRRREAVTSLGSRISELSEEERSCLPTLLLGAEVAWWPTLAACEELPELCIGGTKHLLLELPFTRWNDRLIDQLHEFYGRTGITPVIAHLERYLKIQRPEHIREVLELGVPVQVSAEILLHPFARGGAMKLLRQNQAHLVASDCHDCTKRPPNVAAAMAVLRKKLGEDSMNQLIRRGDELAGG